MTGDRHTTPLPQRQLGRTGILVPPIGLGTVKLGRNAGVKYPAPFDLPDDRAVIELLSTARALGVTLLDTAPAYAAAEQRLGSLLSDHRELAGRDSWTIATKAGESFDPDTATSRHDFSPAAITRSVHESLRRLRTDHLDIVLLHSDGDDRRIITQTGALEALIALRERGTVRAVGISTKTPDGAMLAVECCDVVMLTINPSHADDEPAAAEALRRGVGVLAKKSLLSGHVTASGEPSTPGRTSSLASMPTPQQCIEHALRTPGVCCVVIGTLSPEHLAANANAARGIIHACGSEAGPPRPAGGTPSGAGSAPRA